MVSSGKKTTGRIEDMEGAFPNSLPPLFFAVRFAVPYAAEF
jgi:hypothetical protein